MYNNNIEALELCNFLDTKNIGEFLDSSIHEEWGELFLNIIKIHAIIQNDRANIRSAAKRAKETLLLKNNIYLTHNLEHNELLRIQLPRYWYHSSQNVIEKITL